MIIAAYYYPKDGEADLYAMRGQDGRPLGEALLDRLSGVPADKRLLVSDIPQALRLAGERGWTPVELDRRETHFEEMNLWSLARLAESLTQRGLADPAGPVALIDARNAFLTAESLEMAMGVFSRSDARMLVSLELSRDNPVQLEAAYAMEDHGHIALFDRTPGAVRDAAARLAAQCGSDNDLRLRFQEGALTHPAPLDWRFFKVGRPVPGDVYALAHWPWLKLSQRMIMVRAEAASGLARLGIEPLGYYLCESERSGRRLVDAAELARNTGAALAGVPFVLPASRWTAALLDGPDGLSLFFSRLLSDDETRVRAWPAHSGGVDCRMATEIPGGLAHGESRTVRLGGKDFHGPYATLGTTPAPLGVHYALMRRVHCGAVDYIEPMSIEPGLFSIDPRTKKKILTSTGQELWGRQQLPMYHAPDFALTLFGPGGPDGLEEAIADRRVAWIRLPGAQGVKIRSEIDLWRGLALNRAGDPASFGPTGFGGAS